MMMTIQLKVMAITKQGRLTHIVSQHKCIYLLHRRLAHISSARIVKAANLVDSISLEQEGNKYNPAEVLIDSEDSNPSDSLDEERSPI